MAKNKSNKSVTSNDKGFPIGPTVHLGHPELKKLGLKGAVVGDKIKLHTTAHVTSIGQSLNHMGKPDGHVQLELRKMTVKRKGEKSQEGQIHDQMASGGKKAMDQALEQ